MCKIPKKIHCIWLGNAPFPNFFDDAIRSWSSNQPDYELYVWTDMDFDFNKVPNYVKDAYEDKCYSIVVDYLRAEVLYKYGGWYLDTDVELLKPFMDDYSKYNVVVPVEDSTWDWPQGRINKFYLNNIDGEYRRVKTDFISGIALLISVIGAKRHSRCLKRVMNFYKTLDYNKRDYSGCLFGGPIGPQIWARVMEKYSFRYKAEEQKLKRNIYIAPPTLAKKSDLFK